MAATATGGGGPQAVCSRALGWALRCTAPKSVDSHQAICTPEEAVGSCWAVGEQSLSGSPGRTLGEPGLHEPEELGFHLQRCRALIQTKLSGTPTGGQGSLITYSLFLKTPIHGNGQYITIPRKKKIFSPRNLKLTLFNSDIY
ncbi:hypothetical protein E5288_WYG000055 [Bos mutus]|uniref:Aftiphilin clathrin-binding box domain-containing protein n=1 Tax=Bos mutus TaxID=72004 RepID=A0A6B0RHB7_9CETA|nr:hypothetical protein [Bos mutus]